MTYTETVTWMFEQLPMYQQQGASAYKKDLTNTIALAKHLDNPEKKIKTIHVAGTNGKGSTSSMLASILQEAGYKVGLYTSPHLKDFRERIKINGQPIDQDFVVQFIETNLLFFKKQDCSFFEMTVGLALDYFVNQKVDVAVIEVGMGGRLDATNIITPLVAVITNIGLDHTLFLGNTLEAIAYEKAGIIKPKIPVVIGEYTDQTKPVFQAKAAQCGSTIHFASAQVMKDYPCALLGNYQVYNKKTVLQTLKVLEPHFKISEKAIIDGFKHVISNTGLLGRWHIVQDYPKVVADTAHNKEGLAMVLKQIQEEKFLNLFIVLGVVNDKDLDTILPFFPKNATYFFCKPAVSRGLDALILQEKAKTYRLLGNAYNSVSDAYKQALLQAGTNDFIYIGGSTFVVAEIL